MYTNHRRMPPEMVDWFTRWEADHGIPVRVISGGWSTLHPQPNNNWTDREARACNTTRQQASAQGLTVVTCAASRGSFMDYGATFPVPPASELGRGRQFTDIIYAGTGDPDNDAQIGAQQVQWDDATPIVWVDPGSGNNRVYGEVHDRVVYFYWNIEICTPTRWDYDALFANLEDAVDAEAAARRQQELIARSFDNFMEFMNEGRINRQIEQARTSINQQEANIAIWQRDLANAIATANGLKTQIDAMMSLSERSEQEWRTQYEMIVNNPAVDTVLFRTNILQIKTHHIRLQGVEQYAGQSRWLGRFQIEVNLNNYNIRLRNLDNPQGGRDHPHVPGGAPCFGGNASEFTNLIGAGLFGVFVELILQWLETYNPRDDWGQYASLWFNQPDADPREEFRPQDEQTGGVEEPTQEPVAVAAGVTEDEDDEDDEDIFADDEVY